MTTTLEPAVSFNPSNRSAAATLDGTLHAVIGPLTGGLSPISLALAGADWWLHLGTQPAQSGRLWLDAQQRGLACTMQNLSGQGGFGQAEDFRFSHPAWHQWPFAPVVRHYLAAEAWWQEATALRGMSDHPQDLTGMLARQWVDMMSPANMGLLNPEVLERTVETGGANLVQGVVRVDRPNKRQVLPIVASSPEGVERQTVVIAVERNTKTMEPVGDDIED